MLRKCKYIETLETERLILREVTANDVQDFKEWFALDEVYTYWGRTANKGERNPELLFIDPRPNVKRKPSHDFIWGVELKGTHKIIGLIEIFDVENDKYGMVGYRIAPFYWNQGICTEAMTEIIRFLFTQTKMERIEAHADVRNIGSNSVLRKSGFKLEGTIRHGKMVNTFCDYNIWGFIREDYACDMG